MTDLSAIRELPARLAHSTSSYAPFNSLVPSSTPLLPSTTLFSSSHLLSSSPSQLEGHLHERSPFLKSWCLKNVVVSQSSLLTLLTALYPPILPYRPMVAQYARRSRLQRIPPPLFYLIAQYLPLPEKLLHLTHVCHSFFRLTPSSFVYDTVAWTAKLLEHVSSSPPPPLLSLLSHVPFALFVESSDVSPLLYRFLDPPNGVCPFLHLRAVTIAPSESTSGSSTPPDPSVLAGLRLCPHLTALDLSLARFHCEDDSPNVSWLSHLRSLHSFRLTGNFGSDQLLTLLALPLTCLDLDSCYLWFTDPPIAPLPSLSRLRTLRLPSLYYHDYAQYLAGEEWAAALLSSLASTQDGTGTEVERLSNPTSNSYYSARILPNILPLHRLHTLQLSVFLQTAGDEEDVCAFVASLISTPLPLRHLRLVGGVLNCVPVRVVSALPILVSAYARQLVSLELIVHPHCYTISDCARPAKIAAEAMTAALLSCRSLRRLLIDGRYLSTTVPAPSTAALTYLESLELYLVEMTHCEDTLAVVLDAAPHLRELTLYTPGHHNVVFSIGAGTEYGRCIISQSAAGGGGTC